MIRSMHSRCRELTVVLPDMAKSAATLMCIGADKIIMGLGGDLGPVDPTVSARRSFARKRKGNRRGSR
jgi:ClpP class serine protease